ncbi:MAG: hypothetical protein IJB75_01820 [Oscillospiraceae bacterium]|nr:hypothetical protein [Oscillospiraceae bacterium]
MKNRLNIALLILWLAGAVLCIWNWLSFINIPSFILPLFPAFCSQLLLCRVTKNGYLRALPALPVLGLLAIAGWYAIFGSGWDMLAALIFALAAISPAVGAVFGWLVWWLTELHKRTKSLKEC